MSLAKLHFMVYVALTIGLILALGGALHRETQYKNECWDNNGIVLNHKCWELDRIYLDGE